MSSSLSCCVVRRTSSSVCCLPIFHLSMSENYVNMYYQSTAKGIPSMNEDDLSGYCDAHGICVLYNFDKTYF